MSASSPLLAPSTVFIAVSISLAVWSAVAPDSIPSSFVPSVAKSLPSTVLDTAIAPVTEIPPLEVASLAELLWNNVTAPSPTQVIASSVSWTRIFTSSFESINYSGISPEILKSAFLDFNSFYNL